MRANQNDNCSAFNTDLAGVKSKLLLINILLSPLLDRSRACVCAVDDPALHAYAHAHFPEYLGAFHEVRPLNFNPPVSACFCKT